MIINKPNFPYKARKVTPVYMYSRSVTCFSVVHTPDKQQRLFSACCVVILTRVT